MAYNILEYASNTTDTTTRNPYFRSIVNGINPDILVGIEIEPRNADTWAVAFLNNVLNPGMSDEYRMGIYEPVTNSGANTRKSNSLSWNWYANSKSNSVALNRLCALKM